jgi:MFS family permease
VDRPHHDHLGLLSACTMFVTSTTQFYILRFLLGAAEAGFLPGVLYYLTMWYPPTGAGASLPCS